MKKRILTTALALLVLSALLVLPAGAVGEKSYLPALQDMISQINKAAESSRDIVFNNDNYSEGGSGAFYDLNGDGVDELIAVHWGEDTANEGWPAVRAKLYTKAADGAPVLAVDESLYVDASIGEGFVGVEKKGGNTYFLTFGAGGNEELYVESYSLYSLNGTTATVAEKAEMRSKNAVATYTINGKSATEAEFDAWFQSHNLVLLIQGKNSKGATGLSTLLNQVQALPDEPTVPGTSSKTIFLDGKTVTLDAYTVTDSQGGDTTYVKLRDIAALLNGTGSQFNVDWQNQSIYMASNSSYTTQNGTELKAISGTNGNSRTSTAPVLLDGAAKPLTGIVLTDSLGGGHTFFKLRDLGDALGFTVGWSAEQGIYIETK